MLSRCLTLAARARVYQLVVVALCCCNVGRGEVAASYCLPLLPASETTETEQTPSESAPEEGEASWATPRGRDVRLLGLMFARACAALQEQAALGRPALRRTVAPPGSFEHSFRFGLGAPLRM
ncbi:MAG: hypothetical protein U0836_25460 [Pirellulales bacterium]